MKDLYLIGVNHLLKDLNTKIYSYLEKIKPDAITVEANKGEVEDYFEISSTALLANLLVKKNNFIPGLEFVGAYQYALDNRINLYPVDTLKSMDKHIINLESILAGVNKNQIFDLLSKVSDLIENDKKIFFKRNKTHRVFEIINKGTLTLRDRNMSFKIKNLKEDYSKIAHIGGIFHINGLLNYLKEDFNLNVLQFF